MGIVQFAAYIAALIMAGLWTWALFRQVHPSGKPLGCRKHSWETVEDYGDTRKCRCRKCGHVALVPVIPRQQKKP